MICGLYAITPKHHHDTEDLLARSKQILSRGACAILYRDSTSSDDVRTSQASDLVALCKRYEQALIIYGDVDLAAQVGASGVHFGKDSTNLTAAREQLGANAVIGVSCESSMRRAVQAQIHGANYVMFGAMYVSNQTPLANLAPLSLIRSAKELLEVNVVAIGGITPDNAPPVIQAGADACAVTTLYNDPNCKMAAQAMTALFQATESNGEENVD